MANIVDQYPNFGWKPSSPEKQLQNNRYLMGDAFVNYSASLEKIFTYPNYVSWYDQGQTGACTGYSASWMMSAYNLEKYDAKWLWIRGKETDNDPGTRPNNPNDGGYIWAVFDVLRKEGHKLATTGVISPDAGIQSYYWCKSVDELRTAFSLNRHAVFGIPWYSGFMNPTTKNGEYWIGETSWGGVLGGHAIWCYGFSDARQAVKLRNSWGAGFPDVWLSFASVGKLLKQQSEIAVALDKNPVNPPPPPPPPPPPGPVTEHNIILKVDGVKYTGKVTKK